MRILVLSSKGRGSGCILRARGIAMGLTDLGHHVRFLPPFPTLPFWIDMALDGLWYFLAGLFIRCDVVIGIKPYPTLVPALLWQKIFHGSRIVLDVDDLDYAYSSGWFMTFHKSLQLPWPKRADFVTYHNPRLKEPLKLVFGVPDSKLVSLPQGVATDRFRKFHPKPHELPRAAHAWLGETKPQPFLVYTAHLNQACGLSEILSAMSVLKRDFPHLGLLVAGGGPDMGRYRTMARERGVEDHVRFTGMIPPAEVAACLNLADLVLVYYGESSANIHRASMKLREALACGARVVATNVGEMRGFSEHIHLAPPQPIAFAQAVRHAWKSSPKPGLSTKELRELDWEVCVGPLERKVRQE
jgi:glycosyltransferase involved in cell wall biosynthesis